MVFVILNEVKNLNLAAKAVASPRPDVALPRQGRFTPLSMTAW